MGRTRALLEIVRFKRRELDEWKTVLDEGVLLSLRKGPSFQEDSNGRLHHSQGPTVLSKFI